MKTDSTPSIPAATSDPLDAFAHCHAGIIGRLEQLRGFAALADTPGNADRVRKIAADLVAFFNDVVLEHHAQEEEQLFPAVAQSAAKGDEADLVASLVARLIGEHKSLETAWRALEPGFKRLAKGKPATLDAALVEEFVNAYRAHARFEEAAFLPLSASILGPLDRASLGMQIHMRHALDHVPAYI